MNKILNTIIAFSLISNVSFADCDFDKGITKTDHNTFEYSKDCHIAVGQMKQDLALSQEQVAKLLQAVSLKDLALEKADQRANMWQDTSFKLEARVETIDQMRKTNEMLYFGLGALTVIGAGMMAAQLNRR